MDISNDDIILLVKQEVDDDLLTELGDVLVQIGGAMVDHFKEHGIKRHSNFTTKAYVNISDRFFRMTLILKFGQKDFDFVRKQVEEVDKEQYDAGIERDKNDPKKHTEWL